MVAPETEVKEWRRDNIWEDNWLKKFTELIKTIINTVLIWKQNEFSQGLNKNRYLDIMVRNYRQLNTKIKC